MTISEPPPNTICPPGQSEDRECPSEPDGPTCVNTDECLRGERCCFEGCFSYCTADLLSKFCTSSMLNYRTISITFLVLRAVARIFEQGGSADIVSLISGGRGGG